MRAELRMSRKVWASASLGGSAVPTNQAGPNEQNVQLASEAVVEHGVEEGRNDGQSRETHAGVGALRQGAAGFRAW